MFDILPNGNLRLQDDLPVTAWTDEGIEFAVVVPKGFESDGASIPAILWPVIGAPVRSNHVYAAIVHDWLCVRAETYSQRVIGDAVFFELLKRYGVPKWRRSLMYAGVRFFAKFLWRPKAGK